VKKLETYKERELVAVRLIGVRSTTTAAIPTGLGFEHVSNLKGGMLDWIEVEIEASLLPVTAENYAAALERRPRSKWTSPNF
jgi:hypothetical protein